MRLAFWRQGEEEALAAEDVARPVPRDEVAAAAEPAGDLDLRGLGQALARRRGWIIIPTRRATGSTSGCGPIAWASGASPSSGAWGATVPATTSSSW